MAPVKPAHSTREALLIVCTILSSHCYTNTSLANHTLVASQWAQLWKGSGRGKLACCHYDMRNARPGNQRILQSTLRLRRWSRSWLRMSRALRKEREFSRRSTHQSPRSLFFTCARSTLTSLSAVGHHSQGISYWQCRVDKCARGAVSAELTCV